MFAENNVSPEDKGIIDAIAQEKAKLGITDDAGEDTSAIDLDAPKEEDEETEEVDEDKKSKEDDESDEEDESEDDEETEEEDEEEGDEPDDKSKLPPKHVPIKDHKKLKTSFRTYKEETSKKLTELEETIKTLKGAKTDEEKKTAEDEITALATELEFEPATLKKIIDLARKGLVPAKDIEQKVDKVVEKIDEDEEKAYFDSEWTAQLPAIKVKYPTATDAQLSRVKAEFDKMSHTKEWHTATLDYVIFKNPTILTKHLSSPKKKGIDAGTTAKQASESKEFKPITDTRNMSKASILEHEKRLKEMADGDPEPTRILDSEGRERLE